MKIVLFGKTGQVGRALQSALAPLGQVIAPDRPPQGAGLSVVTAGAAGPHGAWQADLLDPVQLFERTLAFSPDVIVNAAAYTAVDEAEQNQATAMVVNAEAPAA